MGKPRLKLAVANLMVARSTLRTITTTADKGKGHPVTHPPPCNPGTNLSHNPSHLMARDVGQSNGWVMPGPAVPVTQAKPRRFDFQYNTAGAEIRFGHFLYGQRPFERSVNNRFHPPEATVRFRFSQPPNRSQIPE